jgi:FtsZ-interacting cell division protein ZipA
MNWLRLILLIGGLLLIAVLVWLERRRPSRVQQEAEFRGERNEPALGFADDDPVRPGAPARADAADEPAMVLSARGPDPGRSPPLIDWSTPVAAASADPPLINVGDISAVRVMAREQPLKHGEERSEEPGMEPGAGSGAQPLRVEWPPEQQRQIVSLRIVAARQNRISGRLLRQGLSGAGFQHGEFGIFHLGHSDGRVAMSAASLVRPGLLDPAAMDFQSFSGINLFAVLPGPWSIESTLERLTAVAAELAQRVEGRVQDERGMPFDIAHPSAWRERALAQIAPRYAGAAPRPGADAHAGVGGNAGQAD